MKLNTYFFTTEEPLNTNSKIMDYYLSSEECNSIFKKILYVDGTYAEGVTHDRYLYEIYASGNGDFYNHRIDFKLFT